MERPTPKSFEVVVQADDDAAMLFDTHGNVHVAPDPETLGRWALDVARDPRTPSVEFGRSRWMEVAKRLLESQGLSTEADETERVAVHLIVQVTLDDEGELATAAVYPPVGRLRAATTAEKLGAILDALARDEAQPRVPPGPPPNAFEGLVEAGLKAVMQP